MRSIGASRWIYRPFCRRRGRNSPRTFSSEKALGLVAKLGDPLIDNCLVVLVVNVHLEVLLLWPAALAVRQEALPYQKIRGEIVRLFIRLELIIG